MDDLVTSVYPLEKGADAFALLANPENNEIKVRLDNTKTIHES